MKFISLVILFLGINVKAEVIMSPPLSVEPSAGRELVQENAPTGTLVPAKVDPIDGQLVLGEVKKVPVAPVEVAPATTPEVTPATENIEIAPRIIESSKPFLFQKYLQFSLGYLDSKWKKIEPGLENGSVVTDFRVVSDMNSHNQLGFAIELIQDTTKEEATPENIRVLQYKIFVDYHRTIFTDKLDWIAGLALSLGDYSIRKLDAGAYYRIKSGTIYGVTPNLGLRFYLGGRNSIDITVEYQQYISKPQSYIGGFALAPRFSFAF